MIEQKLQQAAENLPEHSGDYPAVEERVKRKQYKSRPVRRKRLAIAMVLAVLLVGCVAVTEPDYHLYNGTLRGYDPGMDEIYKMRGLAWKDTQKEAEKLGITLPETLGGYPVIDFNRYNLTNQEVPHWYALLAPRYVYHSSFYGVEMEEPYVSPDGIEGTRHWREGAEITYGSTNDEIWRRQFGFDEHDVFVAGNYKLGRGNVEEITSQEYQGYTLYIGKILYETFDYPNWDVTWVDYGRGVVFSVDGEFETPDALIGYAKEIIDLNK